MIKAANNICPRCRGPVPNALHKGEYPGALSRSDNKHEVCSSCGTDEAMRQFQGFLLEGPADWPIDRAVSAR